MTLNYRHSVAFLCTERYWNHISAWRHVEQIEKQGFSPLRVSIIVQTTRGEKLFT